MGFTKIAAAGIGSTGTVTLENLYLTGISTIGNTVVGGATTQLVVTGNARVTGIFSATKFIGDISEATGAAAGLGTALSQTLSSPLNKLYYTNRSLSIDSTITVDPPSTSSIAYTQYSELVVEQGADLIVEDGDDLVPDILGLSTGTAAPLSGAGGRVRADQFTNKTGTGAPTFPNGVQVTGVVTATSFSGNINATGVSTLGNTVIGGGTTQVVINGDLRVTGIITSGTSSITIDGIRNIVSTGNTVSVGATSIVVGSTFIRNNSIGLGATTTTGRNAGVGTATGTIIYNSTAGTVQFYDGSGWYDTNRSFIQATGGTVSDYTSGSVVYRAHVFTTSGTFSVTNSGPGSVEYLVVAGGGGGGSDNGTGAGCGGGGAGGFRTGIGFNVTIGSYPITVGSGGVSVYNVVSTNGSDSVLGPPAGTEGTTKITSTGGGRGAGYTPAAGVYYNANSGGSGGGGNGYTANTPGAGNTPPVSPPQGNPGGTTPGGPNYAGSGGGGAGAAGSNGTGPVAGAGGNGLPSSITGISSTYAGGGGGGGGNSPPFPASGAGAAGGSGGGGNGAGAGIVGGAGGQSTGGGGGGSVSSNSSLPSPAGTGGNGGSGIVVVRYQIGALAATAKATGGLISYSGATTIHTFLSSGTFTITNPSLTSVDYLVVAGGGGGGAGLSPSNIGQGGGGGAGGFRTGSGLPVSSSPGVYSVQVGAGGNRGIAPTGTSSSSGTPSIFSTITSQGGGAGASYPGVAGQPGGSGGGAAYGGTAGTGNRETGTSTPAPSQGNNGGSDDGGGPLYIAGGGGGAGGAGGNGVGATPGSGAGGNGLASAISGTSVTYAGGGGGGVGGGPSPLPSGGTGGGGTGGTATTPGTSGTVNLGGGGGGGGNDGAPGAGTLGGNGAAGGSGIVIIAYPS